MFRSGFSFILIILLVYPWCTNVKAQYFYKDIWNTRQSGKGMAFLKAGNIKSISIKSFESDGEPSQGFFCEKQIDKSYTVSKTITRSEVTNQSLLVTYFNVKGLIVKTTDSTESAVSTTEYLYNNNDQIIAAKTFTKASDDINAIEESHNYFYNTAGQLEKMIRRKNEADISVVNFKADEKGNVNEEEELLKNGNGKKYFYYYDDKNNLTDVVHYNERAKRLLPDYMYEYSSTGQLNQMITTEEGGGYYIWRYAYNDQNLRESEKCFSKERKLLGSVQYIYR